MKNITLVLMLAVVCWYNCLAQAPRTRPASPRLSISRSITIGGSLPRTPQNRPRSSRRFISGIRPGSRLSSARIPGSNSRVAGSNVRVSRTNSRFPTVSTRLSRANTRSRIANRVQGANPHGVNSRFPRIHSRFPGRSSRFPRVNSPRVPGVNSRLQGVHSRVPGVNNRVLKANTRGSDKTNKNSITNRPRPINSNAVNSPRNKGLLGTTSNNTNTRALPHDRSQSRNNIQVIPIPAPFNKTITIPINLPTMGAGRLGLRSSDPVVTISARIERPKPTVMARLTGVPRPDQNLQNTLSSSRLSSPLIRSNRLLEKRGRAGQDRRPLKMRMQRQRHSSQAGGSQDPPYTQTPVRHKKLTQNIATRKLDPPIGQTHSKKVELNLNLLPVSKSGVGSMKGSVQRKTNNVANSVDTVPMLANPADTYNGTEMVSVLNSTLRNYGLDIDGLISLLQQTKSQKPVNTPADSGLGMFSNPALASNGNNAFNQHLMADNNVGQANNLNTLTDVRNEIWNIARLLEGSETEGNARVTTMPTTHAPKALIESTGNHVMDEMILQLLYDTFRARQQT